MNLLFLCCFALVVAQNDNSIITRLENLEAALTSTQELLKQYTKGQALFYTDVSQCPPGFHPAEAADGRLLLINGQGRGAASKHTIFTNNGLRSIGAKCSTYAEVAESGMIQVCVNSDTGTDLELNLLDVVPTYSMLLCLKDNTSGELTQPRVN